MTCKLCNSKVRSSGFCHKHYMKQYYKRNRLKLLEQKRQYYQENMELVKSNKRKEYRRNKETYLAINRRNYKIESTEQKVARNLRTRLRLAIKNNQKIGSAIRDLGCSIKDLKQYLESQFKPGMSWNNYGEWHIDHIIPLGAFNLTDRKQLLKACHYTNLQPLWAEENLRKGNN